MSSAIWTPDALTSEKRGFNGKGWRLVEAQHRISTLKLVDTLAEQELLEAMLEDTKPPVPGECAHLDYLLSTPFRYAPYPYGSRFRRAGRTDGVFYCAESIETAVSEMAFYRLLFHAESPQTPWPGNAADYTAFAAAISTTAALDLTLPALVNDATLWTHKTDYGACQSLADNARAAEIDLIRYRSVRDPGSGANLAVMRCRAFSANRPTERQTWRVRLSQSGVQALCEYPRRGLDFGSDSFADDPRLSGMSWKR